MVVTLPLPPNKTHAVRHVTLISSYALTGISDFAPAVLIGVIEIREARTETSEPKSARYAVRREPAPDGNTHWFRLTKPGGLEWYHVLLAEPGGFDVCECKAFDKSGNCKHIQAMRALVKEGSV